MRTVIYTLGLLDKDNSIVYPQSVLQKPTNFPVYYQFDQDRYWGDCKIQQEGNKLVTYDTLPLCDDMCISIGFKSLENTARSGVLIYLKIELLSLGCIWKENHPQYGLNNAI